MQGLELPGGMRVQAVQLTELERAQLQAAQATTLFIEVQLRMLAGWTFEQCIETFGLQIPPPPQSEE